MEDFVSFKIAKKLKKKKFPQHWSNDDYIVENDYEDAFEVGCHYDRCFIPEHLPTIAAPTISQVLKWLRKEKKIHLYIDIDDKGWFFEIKYLKTFKVLNPNLIGRYDTYEEAALAGIEYILDNLI